MGRMPSLRSRVRGTTLKMAPVSTRNSTSTARVPGRRGFEIRTFWNVTPTWEPTSGGAAVPATRSARSGGARSGRARGHRAAAQRLRRARRQRKDDGEPCAAALARALRTNGAAVQLDELADDRESEAEALLRPPSLAKGFEDVGQEGGADSSSGVRDREPREPLYAPEADQVAPAVGRELEGIADEIPHHLLEARRVPEHLHGLGRQILLELDAFRLGRRVQGIE